ncbi:hypothetical protein K490DRAFT_54718 [Saccharata proteae CBS 121410]|uniref:Structure-specific endonuclease subunit SLX4 n=1 Tax=Saccharata proteae CBS 121410 TaxID=1314787 RepID=A0A9P4LX83_9PEZI|nr:hypothetical protein K490DRAFT_54718 [Saccharata proteae CBS 121410]
MTTTDLVILSSSPPKGLIICDSDEERNITPPRPQAILPQSSSPELPSLSAILSRRTDIPAALKSGSKAAQPPQGVDLGFLSAANLVKEQGPGLGKGSPRVEDRAPSVHDDEQLAEPKSAGKLKKVTKRTNTTRVKPKDDLAAKKPRNRKGKGTADVLAEEDGPQSGAYGSNQVRSDPVVGGELANNENPIVGPEPKSVKPRARKAKTVASVVTGKDGSTLVPTKAKKQTRKKATEADAVSAKPARNESGEALTKRRKIEVLGLPENQARTIAKPKMTNFDQLIDHAMTPAVPENSESPAKKDKAARKKPRTITDLATSAYRPDVPKAADSTKSANISKFFAPQKPVSEKPQPEDETEPPKPKRKRAPRQKSPVKKDGVTKPGKAAAKTKNIVKLVSEKLLSPETAKRRMDAQDILFGTSSQLAREDSPTFVRALQQAMQESDAAALGRCGELESLHLRPRPLGSGFSLVGKRRGLWAAAARDEEDTVTDGGVDLPPSPAALPTADVDTAAPISSEEDPLQQDDPPQMESIEIRSSSPPTGLAKEVLRPFDQLLPRTSNDDSHDNTRQVPAFCPPRGDEFDDLPSAQPVEPSSDFMDIDDIEDSELPAHNVFPAMSGPFTLKDAFGLERNALQIDLGDNQSCNRAANLCHQLIRSTTNAPSRSPSQSLPFAFALCHIPIRSTTKAPSRSSSQKLDRATKRRHLPIRSTTNAPNRVALELLSDLRNGVFCRISAAIKGASPTTDPSRPGWWERILLYDPVVVEDLTGWLNGAGVRILVGGKAGRAKAGPKKKKKGKGKGGNKGGGRVDGAEEGVEVEVEVEAEVDAVEQERQTELHELPAWIVQKWCEEHSVCCVYRESLRNGKRSRW